VQHSALGAGGRGHHERACPAAGFPQGRQQRRAVDAEQRLARLQPFAAFGHRDFLERPARVADQHDLPARGARSGGAEQRAVARGRHLAGERAGVAFLTERFGRVK